MNFFVHTFLHSLSIEYLYTKCEALHYGIFVLAAWLGYNSDFPNPPCLIYQKSIIIKANTLQWDITQEGKTSLANLRQ